MDPRKKKQTIIIAIVASFVLAVAIAIYFFYLRPVATCFDSKQNQGEEKIDCGGPCTPCEIIELKPIKIEWIRALKTTESNYDLVARISNVNQNYGAREIKYKFSLFDLNNNLLAEKEGKSFILPREEKFLAEFKVFSANQVLKINLDIEPVQWEKIKDYEPLEIEVFNSSYQVLDDGPVFSQAAGIIKNSARRDYRNIRLIVVVFDGKEEPLAVNSKDIDLLIAKQELYVTMPWFFDITGNVSGVKIEPYLNIF